MIEARFFFDSRRKDKQGRSHIRICISRYGQTAMLSSGVSVLPKQWDGHHVVGHPDKVVLNAILSSKLAAANRTIVERTLDGRLDGKTAKEIMDIIKEELDPEYAQLKEQQRQEADKEQGSFFFFFTNYVSRKANAGTRQLYTDTLNKVRAFCEEELIEPMDLRYEDVTKDWLNRFESFCLKTQRQNTASRHLRDIRAVFNAAIDDGMTSYYPFRKFKIKKEETRDKAFSAKKLRELFNHECYAGGEQEAVDMFELSFCLIGINPVDLANLGEEKEGRVDYVRRKTHKFYSVKVEPEARAIIQQYKGKDHLLDILERVSNYKTYFNRIGKRLRAVGKVRVSGKKSIGKAILPDVCLGSARTSWATIAQEELGIDRDVIAAALGHSTVDVTTTYLRTEWKKTVDNANRMVIEWVLYGKKK